MVKKFMPGLRKRFLRLAKKDDEDTIAAQKKADQDTLADMMREFDSDRFRSFSK